MGQDHMTLNRGQSLQKAVGLVYVCSLYTDREYILLKHQDRTRDSNDDKRLSREQGE